jgi:hypothetical protein
VKSPPAGLTVLTQVEHGHEEQLRAELASLAKGESSPFARVAGTHLARLVVVPPLRGRRRHAIDGTFHLLLSCEFVAPLGDYVTALCEGLDDQADAIWGHCVGYPGRGEHLARYLLEHQVRAGLSAAAYPEASVDEVRRALELRESLRHFVLAARGLDPADLKPAWEREFER